MKLSTSASALNLQRRKRRRKISASTIFLTMMKMMKATARKRRKRKMASLSIIRRSLNLSLPCLGTCSFSKLSSLTRSKRSMTSWKALRVVLAESENSRPILSIVSVLHVVQAFRLWIRLFPQSVLLQI